MLRGLAPEPESGVLQSENQRGQEFRNIDLATVQGFGEEWSAYDQSGLTGAPYEELFQRYFRIFPFDSLPVRSEGFDLGCGSGRWALGVAPRVGTLHCIDPAEKALAVARRRLQAMPNVHFHLAASDSIPLPDESQDFGYSLGVLHHIPDTANALADCVAKLKPGAPFLLYLYYRLDGRPGWFRMLWKATNWVRQGVSSFPFPLRRAASTMIAGLVYWPLARGSKLAEKLGLDIANWPLSAYRSQPFYSMRTDALDRFGTRLEQRFTRPEIEEMMRRAGLVDIRFSESEPFWVAVGKRGGAGA